jgi:hypothetical protein
MLYFPKIYNHTSLYDHTASGASIGAYRRHHHGAMMMEAATSTSETSVNYFYQTARRNNPKDSHLHPRHRKNLKNSTS